MYQEAVADCDKAIEINKDWLKAYIHKGIAVREMVEDQKSLYIALEVFKQGHQLASSQNEINDEIILQLDEFIKICEEEIKDDTSIPLDHPERKRF